MRFSVTKLIFKHNKRKITISKAELDYMRRDLFEIQLKIQSIQSVLSDNYHFSIESIDFHNAVAIEPILSLINLEAYVIPVDYKIPSITIKIDKNQISLSPIEFQFEVPRGTVNFTTPEISIYSNANFPNFTLILSNLNGFNSRPLVDLPRLELNVNIISIDGFKLLSDDHVLFQILSVTAAKKSLEWSLSADLITFAYNTKFGLNFIPFAMKFLQPIIDKNRFKKKKPFKFPKLSMSSNRVQILLSLTDTCSMQFISQFSLENQLIKMPSLEIYFNAVKTVIAKSININMENEWMKVIMESFHMHDRQKLMIDEYLAQVVHAWRAIAPYILQHRIDTESLPFPLAISIKRFTGKFHDTQLNTSLCRASRILPPVLSDSYIREYLMSKKVREMGLDADAAQDAANKLRQLAFQEYKHKLQKEKKHKHILHFTFHDLVMNFDARNFTDKLNLIQHIDPTMKTFYSDLEWENMLGADFECKSSKMECWAYDIPGPIGVATNVVIKGPSILASPRMKVQCENKIMVEGQEVTVTQNPMRIKLYSDMLLQCDHIYWYYGRPIQVIYQDMGIIFSNCFPNLPDPSPKFVWYDLLRFQVRGQYLLKARILEQRYIGTDDYRNLHSYSPIQFDNFNFLFKEGDGTLTSDRWVSKRYYNFEEGSVIFQIFKIIWTFKFKWVNDKNEDPRKHIIFPDVSRFNDPDYDTYDGYRSNAIIMDSTISYGMSSDGQYPGYTVDLAHLDWFTAPVFLFTSRPYKYGRIAKKLGWRMPKRAGFKYFEDIKRYGYLRMIANNLSVRIFDHFPTHSNPNGRSIDFQFREFTALFYMDLHVDVPTEMTCKMKADTFQIDATDLIRHSQLDPYTASSTILTMKPFNMDFQGKMNNSFEIDDISICVNPDFIDYLKVFAQHALELMPTIKMLNKPKPPPLHMTPGKVLEDYPHSKFSVTVKSTRFFISSKLTDMLVLLQLDNMHVDILAQTPDVGAPTAFDMFLGQIRLFSNANGPTGSINMDHTILAVTNLSIFAPQLAAHIDAKSIAVRISPVDIGSLHNLMNELKQLTSGMQFGERKEDPEDKRIKRNISIPLIVLTIFDDDLVPLAQFEMATMQFQMNKLEDHTQEYMIQFGNITLMNQDENAVFETVCTRTASPAVGKGLRSHLLISFKILPKVSGARVFSQVDVNIEPTTVNFEETFKEQMMSVLKYDLAKSTRTMPQFTIAPPLDPPFPYIVFDDKLFYEAPNSNISKVLSPSHADNSETMMFRYFRLSPTVLTISYRNTLLTIFKELNNFQGQLHEVIYHDLSANLWEFFKRFGYDVAKDMIPQVMKHFVGIKKTDVTPEQEIEQWLHTETKSLNQTDKQRILLFGQTKVNIKKKAST